MKTRILTTITILLFFVVSLQAQELKEFKAENGRYGYKDEKGNIVIQPNYSYAYPFKNGVAQVTLPNPQDKFGTFHFLIDKKGNAVTKKYSSMGLYGSIYRVEKNKKYGLISSDGKELVPLIYDFINENNFKGFSEGVVVAKLNDKWGLIDTLGKTLVPFTYDRLDNYNEGLCQVYINKLGGYINKKGEIVIPAKYKNIRPFNDGYAWVCLPEGCAIIDTKGKALTPFKYQNNGKLEKSFYAGIAPVYKDNKLGFINNKGVEIIPCIYDFEPMGNFDWFIDGKAKVKKDGRTFYIDKTGKEVK